MWLAKPTTWFLITTKKLLTPDFSHGKASWVYSKCSWKALGVAGRGATWFAALKRWLKLGNSVICKHFLSTYKRSSGRQALWELAGEKGQDHRIIITFLGGRLLCLRFYSKWVRNPGRLDSRVSQLPVCSMLGKEGAAGRPWAFRPFGSEGGRMSLADSQRSYNPLALPCTPQPTSSFPCLLSLFPILFLSSLSYLFLFVIMHFNVH